MGSLLNNLNNLNKFGHTNFHIGTISEQSEQTKQSEHFLQHKTSIFAQWRIKHLRKNTCEIFYLTTFFLNSCKICKTNVSRNHWRVNQIVSVIDQRWFEHSSRIQDVFCFSNIQLIGRRGTIWSTMYMWNSIVLSFYSSCTWSCGY